MILVRDGQQEYELSGRVAAMVRWLAEQAERLNALPQVRLEFNCAGSRVVKPKLEICEGEVPIR